MLHRIIKSSVIFKLIISLNEWNISILIELRLLVRVHKSVVCSTLAGETILVLKASEAILLILSLHLMNLSLQIGDFLLFFILLTETARINLYIIP